MITINLLPRDKKENLRYHELNRTIVLFCILGTIIFIVIALGAFSLQKIVQGKQASAQQSLDQQNKEWQNLATDKNRIETLNNNILQIKNLSQSQIDWQTVLKVVADRTPQDVQLSKLSIGDASKDASATPASGGMQAAFSGKAASRRSVMKLKDQLESSGYFSNLTFQALNETTDGSGNTSCAFDLTGTFNQKPVQKTPTATNQ